MKKLINRIKKRYSSSEVKELLLIIGVFIIPLVNIIPDEGITAANISSFLLQLIRFSTLFIGFYLFNFVIIPQLILKRNFGRNIIMALIILVLITILFKSFEALTGFLIGLGIYTLIKYALKFIWRSYLKNNLNNKIAPGTNYISILWVIIMLFLIYKGAGTEILMIFGSFIPFGILLYSLSFFKLIPSSFQSSIPFFSYLLKLSFILLISSLIIFFSGIFFIEGIRKFAEVIILNILFQIICTAPLTWWRFKEYVKKNQEVDNLKKELGESTASLESLRSQINPHFLFNVLNTLYSTALNENMGRTSDGIQKLGEMMRYMLYDNLKEKISLETEIEYLKNYIELQKLRIDIHENIEIAIKIEDKNISGEIAPMLLLPFVENAFKHGISHENKSYIRIELENYERGIKFTSCNTLHSAKTHSDKTRNGIGLVNVKERLKLLYPAKFKLTINQTENEFCVLLLLKIDK